MRRTEGTVRADMGDKVSFGPFVVDRGLHTVNKNGTELELTQREYDILTYFLSLPVPVSYTHLDVYKRQAFADSARTGGPRCRVHA